MLCSICYGSGIIPLTRSPSRVMRRTMARLVSTRLPCAACKGTGYVPDPAPARTTPAAPESAAAAAPPDDTLSELRSLFGDEEAALFRKVLSLPGQAVLTSTAGATRRRGVHVVRSIWDDICRASAVVVDLTGSNNNVCLELGLAQAIGRPVLLMTQDGLGDSLFPEIAKLRVSRYSPAGRGLGRIVEGWCSTLAAS